MPRVDVATADIFIPHCLGHAAEALCNGDLVVFYGYAREVAALLEREVVRRGLGVHIENLGKSGAS